MKRHLATMWKFFQDKRPIVRPDGKPTWRKKLHLEALEDRLVPTNFDLLNLGAITGTVYVDHNMNRHPDVGEAALPGVAVTLTGTTASNQAVSLSTVTDSAGQYKFMQLAPGTYSLKRADLPNFFSESQQAGTLGAFVQGQGFTDISLAQGQVAIDNFAVLGRMPHTFSLADFRNDAPNNGVPFRQPGAGIAFADHSVQPKIQVAAASTSVVGGFVYADVNHDNQRNTGDTASAGVQLTLTGIDFSGQAVARLTTTAADGSYKFDHLRAGNYTINVVSQPLGYRAGVPTVGGLGGVAPRNTQITGIEVGTGATNLGYNFGEILMAAPTSGAGPKLQAALLDDTGADANDTKTSDATILGRIQSALGLTAFRAGVDGGAVTFNLLGQFGTDGRFVLNPVMLAAIKGSALTDGAHTLHLFAQDAAGHSSTLDFTFTLDTAAPAANLLGNLTLNDGTLVTTATSVTVKGHVTPSVDNPNPIVRLYGAGAVQTTTADNSGDYHFDVTLTAGINRLTAAVFDAAGNFTTTTANITMNVAPTLEKDTTGAVRLIPGQTLTHGTSSTTAQQVNMSPYFVDPASATVLRFHTSSGPIDVTLNDSITPQTVANFINYVNSHRYDGSVFDRLAKDFVLQGGASTYSANPSKLTPILTDPAVQNEFIASNSNVFGTLAMAKSSGNANSATDAFFFNLSNNSSNLDHNNGGFTVFGKVANGESIRVLDMLTTAPTFNVNANGQNFPTFPLNNYSGPTSGFPGNATADKFEMINTVETLKPSLTSALQYTASSDDASVTATFVGHVMTLHSTGTATTAHITVTATNQSGQSVSAAPFIVSVT